MSYRRFDPEQERLAADWVQSACTTMQWKQGPPVGEGESKSFHVSSGTIAGYAKPGVKKPDQDRTPRAAHEKIASDLAYYVSLPVPPVILWDRGADADQERYVGISASAFRQAGKWDAGRLSDEQKAAMTSQLWSIVPFEVWIAAEDRKAAHVLVDMDSGAALAHIDYAYSMHRVWHSGKEPDRKVWFAQDVPKPSGIVNDVMARIEGLKDSVVEDVVRRIPVGFLNDGQKDIILANLLSRKQQLTSLMPQR